MTSIFSSWSSSNPFVELVEKATSDLLPAGQEDIALNLEICDQVRAKDVKPEQAVQAIKNRLTHKNPNVVLLALGLTDICIKNGGDHFLSALSVSDFSITLANLLRSTTGVGSNPDVKSKALGLLQSWSQLSSIKPGSLGNIPGIYSSLKAEGFQFPPLDPTAIKMSAALLETRTAPEWLDSTVCQRCRTEFTTFNRKHHCRNCGLVYCQQCSSKNMPLPWYGIGQDVRVCEGCFEKKAPPKITHTPKPTISDPFTTSKLSRSSTSITPSGRGVTSNHQRSATLGGKPSSSSSRRAKEEDDLALAIRLSLEASGGSGLTSSATPSQPFGDQKSNSLDVAGRKTEGTDEFDDPDLAAAIAASLRDYAPPAPSAPFGAEEESSSNAVQNHESGYGNYSQQTSASQQRQENLVLPPSLELPAKDVDSILTFSQTVAAPNFASASSHQPHLLNQAEGLYGKAAAARPRMARSLEEAGRRHGVLSNMHEKLGEAVRIYERLLDRRLDGGVEQSYQYQQYNHPNYHQQQYSQPQYSQYAPPPPLTSQPSASPAPNGSNLYPSIHSGPSQHPNYQQHAAAALQSPPPLNATPSAPFSSNHQNYEFIQQQQQYQQPNQTPQPSYPQYASSQTQPYNDPTPSTPSSAQILIQGVAPPSNQGYQSQPPLTSQETGDSNYQASAPSIQTPSLEYPQQQNQGSAPPNLPQFEKLMSPSVSEQPLNQSTTPQPEHQVQVQHSSQSHTPTPASQMTLPSQPHAGVGAHGSRGMSLNLTNGNVYHQQQSSPQQTFSTINQNQYSQQQPQAVSSPTTQYSLNSLPAAPTYLPPQHSSHSIDYSSSNGWNQVPITDSSHSPAATSNVASAPPPPSAPWSKQVESPLIDL